MKVSRGDVVSVDFPFTDRAGSKVRPTLVVLDPRDNPNSGLSLACAVRAENMHTIEQRLVLGSIGYLSSKTMKQVDDCLRAVLGL